MWILRRALAIWLSLAVTCGGVVLIARANPAPGRLEALGFGVCDGEPCWRGIKVGMESSEVARRFPETYKLDHPMKQYINLSESTRIRFEEGFNVTTIQVISYITSGRSKLLPISIGDIVLKYGAPCRVIWYPEIGRIAIYYPSLVIYTPAPVGRGRGQAFAFRLHEHSPLVQLDIESGLGEACIHSDENIRPWLGFTSGGISITR